MSTAPLKTTPMLETAKSGAGRMTIVGFGLAILGMIAIASPLVVVWLLLSWESQRVP